MDYVIRLVKPNLWFLFHVQVFGLQVFGVLDKTSIQIRSGNFNQISYSILPWYMHENHNFYETEYIIRFIQFWNGFCIPFHKKICKFFYETEYRIRFIQFWNGFCVPFPIHFEFHIIPSNKFHLQSYGGMKANLDGNTTWRS